MIRRYETPEIRDIFSDVHRLETWLSVELVVVEALEHFGRITPGSYGKISERLPKIDSEFVDAVLAREAITNHDLAAFVDVVQARIDLAEASYIHYGLTSSDVVDTALSLLVKDGLDVVIKEVRDTVLAVRDLANLHRTTIEIGRTHGMHAEPTTFGAKVVLWAYQLERDFKRLKDAQKQISVGKLSGAVGTYSNIDPEIEAYALELLKLEPVPATQVIARDRHAQVLYALTALSSSIESFATELRHLQRSEVGEVFEPFQQGQKGSSAMPHKRNPIVSERLSGLARVARGYLSAGLEDIALWHERDISHSSVERIVLPDAFHIAHYATKKFRWLIEGLDVRGERMTENLEGSFGLYFSQSILLALVNAGLSRDQAYRIVQKDAKLAYENRTSFRAVLSSDPEVTLDEEVLDEVMNDDRLIRNVNRVFVGLDNIEERMK